MSALAQRNLLPQLKAFQGFTAAELDSITNVLKPERLAPGGVLFREGQGHELLRRGRGPRAREPRARQ